MKTHHAHSGFSLIETIIAISVIALALTAAAHLTSGSLATGRSTMNQFIAFHLAEEGLEITRAIRDSNWLANRAFGTGLAAGSYVIGEGTPYQLNRISSPETAPEIILSEQERFRRVIEITNGAKAGLRVTSTVRYMNSGSERKISLSTDLTDWKKGPL